MIKVLFICHGNICRSTLAEGVFTHKVTSLGLAHNFEIDSFATSREEIGNPPHYGTVNKLREEHIPLVPHHAKQITWKDYERADYIIGMDTANIRNLNRMLKNDPDGKVYKFLSFTGSGRDIRIRGIREILRRRTAMSWRDATVFWRICAGKEKSEKQKAPKTRPVPICRECGTGLLL